MFDEPVARLFTVVLDQYTKEKEGAEAKEPLRLDPIKVIAGDAEEAVTKAKKVLVGTVYEGEIDGEAYQETVIRAALVSVNEVTAVDIL